MHPKTLPLLLATTLALSATAQDVVTLHSVTIGANDDVTVVYSKNFATCAHLRFSDPSCQVNGPLTHTANHFCTQGTNVAITVPLAAFAPGFGPHVQVFLVHGNNGGVRSACVAVGCDGAYGAGCAGALGTPLLDAVDDCPAAGTSLDLVLTGGLPGSLAVLGAGLSTTSVPLLGCTLLVGAVQGTVLLPLDATGAATFLLPLPPGTAGFVFPLQAFVLDAGGPQGFAATNGLLVRIA